MNPIKIRFCISVPDFAKYVIASVVVCCSFFLLTQSAHADHFRAGTMSWEVVDDESNTVLIKAEIGWKSTHGHIPTATPVGGVVQNRASINFGDGTTHSGALRVVSRNTVTNDVQTELVSIKPGEDSYTPGVLHTYDNPGDYVVYWGSSARTLARNLDGSAWRNETLVNIGGQYAGNSSPITAMPSVVQVGDNRVFTYTLVGTDSDGDEVSFRYGSKLEFFGSGTGEATKPTGLQLSSDGTITWDVSDSVTSTNVGDRWQMTVMLEDLDDEGEVKSYVPLDFVLLISDSSNEPPIITAEQNVYSVTTNSTVTFSLVGTDPDWETGDASPAMTVINPPSGNADIWSTAIESEAAISTMLVSFTPTTAMGGSNSVVVFQATDEGGNATTKSITIQVQADETAPEVTAVALTVATTSAVVTWTTNEEASSRVAYGLTSLLGTSIAEINTSPRVSSHEVTVPNLLPCTMYYYAVVAKDGVSNTASSSPASFVTNGCTGNTEPESVTSETITASSGVTARATQNGKQFTVKAPENSTATSSSFVIQVKPIASDPVIAVLGRPSTSLNEIGGIVFDVKAIINGDTVLDSFDAAVTIEYEYTDDEIRGLAESSLWLYHYTSDNEWAALHDCSLDMSINTISCTTPSFSIFGLFGTGESRSRAGSVVYGCKDSTADNYNYFSRHKQELCVYPSDSAVLPASEAVASVPTSVCTPHINSYIRYGADNNIEDVKKLETFLNEKQGEQLVVDGVYSEIDVAAVKRFQMKYASEVLQVWGINEPTGYVYRTTVMKINSFYCNAMITCPAFSEFNSVTENAVSAEVTKTKTLLTELGFYSGRIDTTFDATLQSSLKNFQETFSETMLKPWGMTFGSGYKYKTTNKFLNLIVGCETGAVVLDGQGTFDY